MKLRKRSFGAAIFGLVGLISLSAAASTSQFLPFSAGVTATDGFGRPPCDMPSTGYLNDGNQDCSVDVPIEITPGHTIQQIAVIHSSDNTNLSPFILAKLITGTFNPWSNQEQFAWSSSDSVPGGTVYVDNLMDQVVTKSGVQYLDQFQVAPNSVYHVQIDLRNGAGFEGLEITYQ